MNQHDQMRQTVDRLLGEIVCLEWAIAAQDPWSELELRVRDMRKIAKQALSHINETLKNEHDSNDVLNKTGNVDMMREALQQVRRDIESLTALQNGTVNHIVKSACGTLDRVLQALAAERLPLVRLTEQEAKAAYQRGIDESENRGIQSAAHWLGLKTVMDAMERVNGGQQ